LRFQAREGKKVKYVFANITAQMEKKLNPHANTPAVVKTNEAMHEKRKLTHDHILYHMDYIPTFI
jgi:hypothetical protein